METKEREYSLVNDTGEIILTEYNPFSGIRLIYCSARTEGFDLRTVLTGEQIELHHCRSGRMEVEGRDLALTPGSFYVSRTGEGTALRFPLGHYQGIVLSIHEEIARKSIPKIDEAMQGNPLDVIHRLCEEGGLSVLHQEPSIDRLFSEMYLAPQPIRMNYLKVKLMELFLILSSLAAERPLGEKCGLPDSQVKLANRVAQYLSEHMDNRVTTADLARVFGTSPTQLKNSFKAVYGVPVFTFARIQRMKHAAHMLTHTNQSVTDVALALGYSNTGKFAGAFKTVMGELPSEYRRSHKETME